jgi:hypothetical protein
VLENDRNVVIFSDSLSSLMSIEGKHSSSRPNLIKEILEKYNEIADRTVLLVWIPSHVDITGNETADSLAKSALGHQTVDREVKFEASELNELTNKYINIKWQEMWNNSKTGKFNKVLNEVVKRNIKYENRSRGKEVTITRLRLGKCRLNKYLKDIGVHTTGLCDMCAVPETSEHYLMDCHNSPTKEIIKAICIKENILFHIKDILASQIIIDAFYPHINRVL